MKGNSAIGAAAYQSGEKIYSEYEHEWKSGDHLERIIHKEILLPPNAPEKFRDRATLWNAVDASETKTTAQTARRIIMALPKELTQGAEHRADPQLLPNVLRGSRHDCGFCCP